MPHISLLLGAGFSVNKGYPTAQRLNKRLVELDAEDFYVHTDGTVLLKSNEKEDPCWWSSDAKCKYFVVQLIKYYSQEKGEFNYEDFYDFYNEFNDGKQDKNFDELCNSFREKYNIDLNNINLISRTNKILNQLLRLFIVDNEGNMFYESVHYAKPLYTGYTGFLNCLEKWGEEGIVHIHSLNHDLFLESLSSSDWMKGNFSDGFEELGSPYYGGLKGGYKVRLPYFTNKFNSIFRLYKLHGSFDQVPYHLTETGIRDAYIKFKFGIGLTELYKEVSEEGTLRYDNDWINYHSDFLTGTTLKILRYKEPLYYEKVFKHFEENLLSSERLIVIGYGCRDSEINNIIEKKFDYQNKPIFVIDPYPSEYVNDFCKKYNAKLLIKTPDDLEINDF